VLATLRSRVSGPSRVLNDDLAPAFQRWYPAFDTPSESADTDGAAA